ncbi:hypothetical protein [Streptomyces echinatus]|uniref:Uncharacterized protein n=1 Tax=Streptomyces echinatus TaxID=67293 RepID=A0A7W9Q2Q4_9ACTN|nr:hypothetical protein [Streptomyces echinatus]MBB5932450.1 hypothetical protein [Streptomyces echinatus]
MGTVHVRGLGLPLITVGAAHRTPVEEDMSDTPAEEIPLSCCA